ncbi:STIV orfB116 family protein [Aphanothece minutissima]|nr:DUF1874 domain-containing protein [Aphanothece minutissima]
MTTYLLNTTIVPCPGLWDVQLVNSDPGQAVASVVAEDLYQSEADGRFARLRPEVVSAIGHLETASYVNALFATVPEMMEDFEPIPANRLVVQPEVGDLLVCIKLKGRPPEGVILSEEQMAAIGHQWMRMRLISAPDVA